MEFKYKHFSDFLSQKGYKEIKELSEDEAVEYQGQFLKEMREFQNELQAKALKDQSEEVKSLIKETEENLTKAVNDQVSALLKVSKTQGEAIAKMMSKGDIDVSLSPFEKSVKDSMEMIKKGSELPHSKEREFVVKTAFTAASVTNNTDSLRLTDIGQLATRQTSIWDSLPKVPVPKNANGTVRYSDWDEASTASAAAMIAEGGVYPESTAAFEEYSMTIKKVGNTIPISEESLYDRARFAAELDLFIKTRVDLEVDEQVYSGDGTGNNMTGFQTTAIPYVPVASGIADASIYDLFVKMKESMTAGKKSKYMPNTAYMNISDINRYKLKKDANNNYVMPPFVDASGNVIDGVRVIESNIVTLNTLTMVDSRYIRVYEESGITVSTGRVDDQFVKDMITMKARRRANVLVREADRGAAYFCSDISAALVALTA